MIARVPLAKIAQINPRLPKDTDESQHVSFLAMASVSEDGRILDQETRVLAETKKGYTYFERGDVLLAKITPCFENGKAALVDNLEYQIGYGSTEFHVLRADPELLDSKYLFYMVWSDRFRFFGEKSMQGAAGQKRVSADFLQQFEIPLPPLAEQKRIAAILDKADALRRKRQQAIELADQFLRSVFLDMFGDPVTNPKGWETRLMSELVRLQGGFAFKSSDFVDAGIPVVKIGNANKGEFDITNLSFMAEDNSPSMKKYELFEGDMLLTLTGTVGKDDYGNITRVPAGYDKWYLNQRVAKIELCSGAVNSSYIEYLLSSPEIKKEIIKASRGVRQANISNSDVYSLRVPVPNKQSQDQFERIVKQLIATRTKLKLMIPQLEVFFGSLSQQAFNGKL